MESAECLLSSACGCNSADRKLKFEPRPALDRNKLPSGTMFIRVPFFTQFLMETKLCFRRNQMLNMELHMDASEELEVEDITRQFAEATNLSLISVDSHGDIEFVNHSACLLFG